MQAPVLDPRPDYDAAPGFSWKLQKPRPRPPRAGGAFFWLPQRDRFPEYVCM